MKNSVFVTYYLKSLITVMIGILSTVTLVVPMNLAGIL